MLRQAVRSLGASSGLQKYGYVRSAKVSAKRVTERPCRCKTLFRGAIPQLGRPPALLSSVRPMYAAFVAVQESAFGNKSTEPTWSSPNPYTASPSSNMATGSLSLVWSRDASRHNAFKAQLACVAPGKVIRKAQRPLRTGLTSSSKARRFPVGDVEARPSDSRA
jgi:hypothetical protein